PASPMASATGAPARSFTSRRAAPSRGPTRWRGRRASSSCIRRVDSGTISPTCTSFSGETPGGRCRKCCRRSWRYPKSTESSDNRDLVLSLLRELYDHMQWADATVWRAALATAAADDDAKTRERFWHVHVVQRAFLSVWRGEEIDRRDAAAFAALRDIADWGRETHEGLRAHVAAVDDSAL